MSLRALAAAIGVSPSHLSRGARGAADKTLRPQLIDAAAGVLDVPPSYFAEVREHAVIEAVKQDGALRDRIFQELGETAEHPAGGADVLG
jgi:transcriptional regulator with XRE-family HTH domain